MEDEDENLQNRDPNVQLDLQPIEALQLDAFYQDLIRKERQQFERILKSKTNVARSDALQRMRRQID